MARRQDREIDPGLAHLRRMRFGATSEVLAPGMGDLFDETLAADIAACEARLEAER